jgi:hypothetical protein
VSLVHIHELNWRLKKERKRKGEKKMREWRQVLRKIFGSDREKVTGNNYVFVR